jgi:hypothetical protein
METNKIHDTVSMNSSTVKNISYKRCRENSENIASENVQAGEFQHKRQQSHNI